MAIDFTASTLKNYINQERKKKKYIAKMHNTIRKVLIFIVIKLINFFVI